jgi:hypothetical protein
MSGKDKAAVILVLVICIWSLAVHFVMEGLSPAGGPGFDFVTEAGHTHPVHEHSDDDFVLVRAIPSSQDLPTAFLSCPAISGAFSYSISPLLPPPNF